MKISSMYVPEPGALFHKCENKGLLKFVSVVPNNQFPIFLNYVFVECVVFENDIENILDDCCIDSFLFGIKCHELEQYQ